MAFLIETQDESSWFDWNMWMVHSIRSTMYGYLQRKNQQHTHFSLICVTKVWRLPEYMWIRINSKKRKKRNTEWLAMWNHTFLFYEFHHVYCTYVNCNSVTSRELMVWYSRRNERKKKQQKNTNDWDFNIQFRIWLFWISIIQQLKWHSQLTH